MPARNHGRYITEAIESFLEQDFSSIEKNGVPEVELIISDDDSDDSTFEIARGFAERFPERIRVYSHKKRLGLIGNYRFLLNMTDAVYVAVLESDDFWLEKDKLSVGVSYMEKNPECGLVFSGCRTVDADGKNIGVMSAEEHYYKPREAYGKLLFSNFIPAVTVCFRKKIADEYCNLNDYESLGFTTFDFPVWLAISAVSGVYSNGSISAAYRITSSSISNSGDYEKRKAFQEGREKIVDYTLNRFGYDGSLSELRNEEVVKRMLLALSFGKYSGYFYFCRKIKVIDVRSFVMRFLPVLFILRKRAIIGTGALSVAAAIRKNERK
jgi:glycosyltransferase involved in cell wall biosynthesis